MHKKDVPQLPVVRQALGARAEMLSATVHVASLKSAMEKLLSEVKTLDTNELSSLEALMRQATYVLNQSAQTVQTAAKVVIELEKQLEHAKEL